MIFHGSTTSLFVSLPVKVPPRYKYFIKTVVTMETILIEGGVSGGIPGVTCPYLSTRY